MKNFELYINNHEIEIISSPLHHQFIQYGEVNVLPILLHFEYKLVILTIKKLYTER